MDFMLYRPNLTVCVHRVVSFACLSFQNDHSNAAQNLVHVAKNVSKFPAHVVPILTSTGE